MKRSVTQDSRVSGTSHAATFEAVFDSRKRKIPGLWKGDGRTAPRRIPLDAESLNDAKAELESKRTKRRDGKLPQTAFRPKFEDFAAEYVNGPILAQKKTATQANEPQSIGRWTSHLGGIRIDKISPPLIHDFREKRLARGLSARTVNLEVVALRNVLKLAVERGFIERLPEVRQLKQKPAQRRPLMTKEQFEGLLGATTAETTKNADLFRLSLRFLALTGAREKVALAVRWENVDFKRGTVTIGRGGAAKNHHTRDVDFSPELKSLIREMSEARPPDTTWLFPSPQRGEKDIHAKRLRESVN